MGQVATRLEMLYGWVERAISRVTRGFAWIATASILVIMLSLTVQVVGRLFDQAVVGVFELNQLLMVIVVFFGFAYTQNVKGHVRVELAVTKFPRRVQLALDIATYIVALAVMGYIVYATSKTAAQSWRIREYAMGTVHFPIYYVKTLIPIGSVLLCMQLLVDIASRFVELTHTHGNKKSE